MRDLSVKLIEESIYNTIGKIAFEYPNDIKKALIKSKKQEKALALEVIDTLIENEKISYDKRIPLCQDTGMAIIHLKIGQEVHFVDGNLKDAINLGVKRAYSDFYLRNSVVDDPIFLRKNTLSNTPAIINYEIVDGENVKIDIALKGFGSENMSRIKMLKPADGVNGVKDFIIETCKLAGPNACPPIVVGVGIGGTFEKAALLAKQALFRKIDLDNENNKYQALEQECLDEINRLNIGPAGLKGKTTALGVNIEYYPTHIAGLPVAVNISCHATRHSEVII